MYGPLLTATYNYQLFQYAAGLANDNKEVQEIADMLAPTVVVPGAHGQYKIFHDSNSFQRYSTERALGGGATRIVFEAEDGYYNCKPQALEVGIDVEELKQAGDQGSNILQESKIRALVNGKQNSHLYDLFTYAAANVTAHATYGTGWKTNPDVDPIAQLSSTVSAIATDVGSVANIQMLVGLDAWLAIINGKQVRERVKYAQATPMDETQFTRLMLGIPISKVKIHSVVTNTALPGNTVSKARLAANEIYIFYSQPNPSVYDPSAFKTFTTKPAFVDGVRQWPTPDQRQMIYALDWSRQFKLTSSLSVRRITVT